MTDKEKLRKAMEDEFIPKIYGFCRLKTNRTEDAEDLSQDIAMEVFKAIDAGKDIENLNAFVWSVSNHMFFNWLRKRRHGTTMYLSDLLPSEENLEEEYLLKEQERLLHREISLLTGSYREAVVLHYYDNLSCEEIGRRLNKSAGTVKWWLHDARKAIKEGMNMTKEYGERSYHPGNLYVSCQGQPGADYEPMSCAKRKSAQNILLAAYQRPMTIGELCVELGISAPYVEDEVQYLVENQLIKEVAGGTYQTDFVILPGENSRMADAVYEACFPEYYEKLKEFLDTKKEVLISGGFHTAGFSWERLLWVYIPMFTDMALNKYKYKNGIQVRYQDMPERPNGGKWIGLGYENGVWSEKSQLWKEYHVYDGPVNKTEKAGVQGFFHYWSGSDSTVFFETPDEVFTLCRKVSKGELLPEQMDEEQKYLFSIALKKKLFLRQDGGFRQNYYLMSLNHEEYSELETMAEEFYNLAEPYFQKAYDLIQKEYASKVPKRLHWQMGNFLSNHLNVFVTCSLYLAVENRAVSEPETEGREWLSLFAIG